MSLRIRIALLTVVIVAGALLAANLSISQYVETFLRDRIDERLERLGPGVALVDVDGAEFFERAGVDPSQFAIDAFFVVRCDSGSIASADFVFGSGAKPPTVPESACSRKPGAFDISAPDGTPYRALAEDTPSGRIVVAQNNIDARDTLESLLIVQVVASVAVLAAVLGLVWWLTAITLRPLRRIELTAAAIAAGDLSRRIRATNSRTEVGRLSKSLNAMLTEIEDAFAAKDASAQQLRRFVADASHELRTPLATVRGYAELLERGVGDEERAIAAHRIVEHGVRMSDLVDNLLFLARLDEGHPVQPQPVDLVPVVDGTVADALTMQPERQIEMRAPESLVVTGDHHQLIQVVTNLVTNALVHTSSDTPLEIELEDHEGAVRMAVIDHGPGIPEDLKPQVFDRFVRADTSRSRSGGGGSGLGLAIVAAIVDAHGGRYGMDDTPGTGATFWVELPTSPAESAS